MRISRRNAIQLGWMAAWGLIGCGRQHGAQGQSVGERTKPMLPASDGVRNMKSVRLGVDVLMDERLELLEGQRVGLITNHTGFDSLRRPTIDLLHEAPGVDLACLMAPEHGIRGDQDRDGLASEVDAKTGLPVHSLYGDTREPTPEMLEGLDSLVFDIQDVGARFYTYIATLSKAMAAAGRRGIPVVVLDRPNPASGAIVEGPMCDTELLSFVGPHEIAMRHGMTIGELALLFHRRFNVGVEPVVVPCGGWERWMFWDDTGLPYVGPSPNLHTVEQAIIYPGPCLMESSNLSVGRGTESPFELLGAPWMDPDEVLKRVPADCAAGIELQPEDFTPSAASKYPYAGEQCHGIRIRLTQREVYRAMPLGLALAAAIRDVCDEFRMSESGFARLCGRQALVDSFLAGAPLPELLSIGAEGLDPFMTILAPCLLYPDGGDES